MEWFGPKVDCICENKTSQMPNFLSQKKLDLRAMTNFIVVMSTYREYRYTLHRYLHTSYEGIRKNVITLKGHFNYVNIIYELLLIV